MPYVPHLFIRGLAKKLTCGQFVLGALFAGQLNSGINAAWVICYLAADPYWLGEVRKEIQATTDQFVPGPEPLLDRLGKLPLEAWEQSFPVIDLCLRDSIRLQSHGTGFRKNVSGKPLAMGKYVVPQDGFMASVIQYTNL